MKAVLQVVSWSALGMVSKRSSQSRAHNSSTKELIADRSIIRPFCPANTYKGTVLMFYAVTIMALAATGMEAATSCVILPHQPWRNFPPDEESRC
ncbi:MAG: hypothetical protein J5605_09135 [Bacteroidales bacterium]|nr:hypothetical protein [Bacteroidales bacterium]